MSLIWQWVLCGLLGAAALLVLLRRLGLGARRGPAAPACSGCAHCPATEEILKRIEGQ